MLKYTKDEIKALRAVEVYELVLNGYIRRFPNGFWQGFDGYDNGFKCLKYLLEEKLKFTDEDIKLHFTRHFFSKYKLYGMFNLVFNGSPYAAIQALYPGRFKPWDMCMCPAGYWLDDKNCIEATKWLFEEKLKWDDDDIKEKLTGNTFIENGLAGMSTRFNDSTYTILNMTYPDKFKPWDLIQTSGAYWKSEENRMSAIKWLFEEALAWTDDEIKEKFDANIIIEHNLFGLLKNHYNGSPYEFLNAYAPGKFLPWELKQTSKRFWNIKENRIKAVKWLIDKENINDSNIFSLWTRDLFSKHSLSSLIIYHKGNTFSIIDEVFPNKFKNWEITVVPPGYWSIKEHRVEAIKWLIEDKLKWSDEEIYLNMESDIFRDYKLSGLLQNYYNCNVYRALEEAYPGRFKVNLFNHSMTPHYYWSDRDNRLKALYDVCDKLNISMDELKQLISVNFIKEHNLGGISSYYQNSIKKLKSDLF
ncbi:MAG: DUF4046 domain-containing protein [Romboutsia sp.]|nr:DUF4046 domain-containing protein [Romboutsia sp.]